MLHATDDCGGGFLVTCDDCGRDLEFSSDEGDFRLVIAGDDMPAEIEEHGWERWEDGNDRCPPCMDAALASGDWATALNHSESPADEHGTRKDGR